MTGVETIKKRNILQNELKKLEEQIEALKQQQMLIREQIKQTYN